MSYPVRFGIQTAPQNVTLQELRECWQTADRAGFDIAYVFDHFIPIFSDENGPCMECFTTLTALACATENIRVSTLVVGNSYRHPAVLANICATLDVISGGRFELGIGAGWWEREYRAYGMEFPPIGRRIRMMEEAVRVVRLLGTEPAPSFKGRYYALDDARMEPKPIQEPCFPIFIGGRGEQLTLRAVARVGDGWNIIGTNLEEFERKLGILLEHCEREGRDAGEIRKSVAMRFSGMRPLPPGAPAGGAITGSIDEMTEQVGRLIEAGADEVTLSMRAPYDLDGLARFAKDIAPSFR
jgi:F420-dependent oxidoreductase-like protein